MNKNVQTDETSGGEKSSGTFIMEESTKEGSEQSGADLYTVAANGDHEDSEEEELIAHFYTQISTVLSDTSSKLLGEAQKFNSAASSRMAVALSKMKLEHDEEQENLHEELRSTKKFVCSLENSLCIKDMQIKNLIRKIEVQKDLLLLSKAFHRWRWQLAARKREIHLSAIADMHYNTNLKQKIFCKWRHLLKLSWKKRMELEANVEILEAQKKVVSVYETKIKNLEDNITEAGKKIDKLMQCNLKPAEDLSRPGPSQEHQTQNSFTCYKPGEGMRKSTEYEKSYVRPGTSSSALCSECSSQPYLCPAGPSFTYSVGQPVSYVLSQDESFTETVPALKSFHPSSQPQSMPIMGTPNLRNFVPQKRGQLTSKPTRPKIMVERHIAKKQVIPGVPVVSRIQSAKIQFHKKVA